MSSKNETPVLVISLLITVALIGGGIWWLSSRSGQLGSLLGLNGNQSPASPGQPAPGNTGRLEDRLSTGDRILVTADTNADKQAGVAAMASGDYATAISRFEAALQANRNDPEALIYLNNAKVAANNPVRIAVSVPIGSNLNVAKEILRGVAQAQDELNRSGGINGTPLQVEIANDDNNVETVRQLAQQFAQDNSIMAVVGHNSSDASLAAAPIYQQSGLVMISPTSDAKALSGVSPYVFRTVPSIRFVADTLSRYAINTANKTKIVVCTDSQAQYSQSLREEFTSAVFADGGRIGSTACDFSAPNFNPDTVISQAISEGADAVLLAPSVDRLNQAIAIAQASRGRLTLLSSPTLYTFETLQQGQAATNGLILAVAWHPTAFNNNFSSAATALWGGPVNWRTAMAYDATEAIIQGLQQNRTRSGLQQALSNPGFQATGATGEIRFLPSGDRDARLILVKVQPGNVSGTGYDFVPLP
jgi:branched-chain amino acid transport system substrate-binding protein